MIRDATRLPSAAGVKLTLTVQLAPAGTNVPQVFVWAKSPGLAPAILIVEMLMAALPLLVSVMVCAALVAPTFCPAKLSEPGDNAVSLAAPRPFTPML